jgi:hypothetical protein
VTEARIIDVLTEERDAHARTRATAHQAVDPNQLTRAACPACQRSVAGRADRGLRLRRAVS